MGMLRWFNKESYDGIGEALNDIRKEIKALQPRDSSDIVWSTSNNGVTAKLRNTNANQTELNDTDMYDTIESGSMFQVQDISEYDADTGLKIPKIQVIDGLNPDSDIAGYINNRAFPTKSFSLEYNEMVYLYAISPDAQSTDIVLSKQRSVSSNIIIVRLIATIYVSRYGKVDIQQMIKPLQNFDVPLYQNTGSVSIYASYNVSDKKISFSASVQGEFIHNTSRVEIPQTELRDDQVLLCVSVSLTEYPINTPWEFSIVFGWEVPDNHHTYRIIRYSLGSDDDYAFFSVQEVYDLNILTFTRLYIPSEMEVTQ
jgi:hypothetical protein